MFEFKSVADFWIFVGWNLQFYLYSLKTFIKYFFHWPQGIWTTLALHKKWSFPLRITSVNISCGFGQCLMKNLIFCRVPLPDFCFCLSRSFFLVAVLTGTSFFYFQDFVFVGNNGDENLTFYCWETKTATQSWFKLFVIWWYLNFCCFVRSSCCPCLSWNKIAQPFEKHSF